MKKLIALIAMLAIAESASAVLMDDFTGAAITINTGVRAGTNPWARPRASTTTIKTTGGNSGSFMAVSRSGGYGTTVCGWFELSSLGLSTGTYQLKFDCKVSAQDSNNDLKITVGTNNGQSGYDTQVNNTGGRFKFKKSGSTSTLDIDNVDVLSDVGASGWVTHTATFTTDASDTHIFIGFLSEGVDDDAGEYIGIDNLEIVLGTASSSGTLIVVK